VRTVSARHILLVFVAGALVRLALLRIPRMWYDEATVGIMGLVVLRGEWPVYFHGQPFMGALDAYLAAPLYFAVGASVRTLELVGVLVALAWVALALRLAWEAFGARAALFAALLLALPPDYLLYWSHEGRPVYLLGMVFGTLALLLALRAPALPPGRAALCFALLGAVLGMAFWTNFLTLVYFPAVAATLLVRGFRLRHVPAALTGIPAFLLGSLPHWLYGIPHGTALPPPGGSISAADLVAHVRGFSRVAWPLLAGVPLALRDGLAGEYVDIPLADRLTPAGAVITLGLAVLYGVAVLAGLRLIQRGRPVARSAMAGLLVLLVVNVGLAVASRYGRALGFDARYLVPAYTTLPLVLGWWLGTLPARWAAGLVAAVLVLHGADALSGSFQNLRPAVAAAERAQMQVMEATVETLRRPGPVRLYAPDFGTRVMTFLSGEQVIFSNHYEEIYPGYVLAVDGAERAGWWLGGQDPTFDANLRALGARFAYRPLPLGGVYTDFAVAPQPMREIAPGRLGLTASHAGPQAAWVADRDAATLWSTGRPKRGGEWLQVDLGAVEPVAMVRWLPGTYQEVPTGVVLEASVDGAAWQRLIELPTYVGPLYWSAGRPMGRVRSGRVELRVPPTPARYLRITQTGANSRWHWTVRELFVYAAAGAPAAEPPPLSGTTVAGALRAAGVSRVYADHGWSARAALADPSLRILPANLALDAYNFKGHANDLLPPARWGPGAGVLLEAPDADGFVAAAASSGLAYTERAVGHLRLFGYAPPPSHPGIALPASALRLSASREAGQAALAADGDSTTRWASAHPQAAGDWIRIDLDRPRQLRAVRLWTAYRTDAPRALALEASDDGVTWRPLAATTSRDGDLRWGGIALLRDGARTTWLDVPPTRASALRLTLTRGDPVFDWSIHELAVHAAE
jgi:hypothetical protein